MQDGIGVFGQVAVKWRSQGTTKVNVSLRLELITFRVLLWVLLLLDQV